MQVMGSDKVRRKRKQNVVLSERLPKLTELLREQSDSDFGDFNLWVPHLFPFQAEPAGVVIGQETAQTFASWKLTAAEQRVVGVLMTRVRGMSQLRASTI